MQYARRSFCGILALAAGLVPLAATVHAQDIPATGPLLSVDQARAAFTSAGYQVGQAHVWDWTQPPVATFDIHDQVNDRVVMVLVYPSATAAQLGRVEAEAHEQTLSAGQPLTRSDGPHLVIGYGPSIWNGNIALVQTSQTQLERMYRAQTDRDNGVYVDPDRVLGDPNLPTLAVDLDFQQALQNGAVNL
jgi:hypothetical protein